MLTQLEVRELKKNIEFHRNRLFIHINNKYNTVFIQLLVCIILIVYDT